MLQNDIDANGPWFQNCIYPTGEETIPGAKYPRCMWGDVKPFVPDLTGATVLDIGCNGGWITMELEKMGGDVTAIDVEDRFIRQTNITKREFGLKCDVHLCDIEQIEHHPKLMYRKWDVVMQLGVIYHVNSPIVAMRNTLAVTKELCIIETDIEMGREGSCASFLDYDGAYKYTYKFTKKGMEKLIAISGGDIVNCYRRPGHKRYIITVKPNGLVGLDRVTR